MVNSALELAGQTEGTLDRSHDPRGMAQHLLNSMYGLRALGATSDRRPLSGIAGKVLLVL